MFKSITEFFKRFKKSEKEESKSTAKERLHLVLAQDRANISADFLEMMKQEIIEVIKKYIDIDEKAIDVRLTNKEGEDGSVGAPALYANIPIITIKNEARKLEGTIKQENQEKDEGKVPEKKQQSNVETKEEESISTEQEKELDEEKETKKNIVSDELKVEKEEIDKGQDTLDNNKINEVNDEEENS